MKTMQSLLTFVLSPDNVRRIGPESALEVEKLTLKNTEYLFGPTPVDQQLDHNFLSLGVYNEHDELAGVLSFNNFPNIPSLPRWEWQHWLHNLYQIEDVQTSTSLWIHYAVWDRRYTTLFMKPTLQALFLMYDALEDVVMVCPPGITRLDFIEDVAKRVLPQDHSNPTKVQTLYVAKRKDFVGQYVIRRAVEEDNDDLVAIIPQVVENTYGHYYISELLNNEEETDRQLIVAEYRGCAVGVLCLNEVVNYDLLNEEFELVPYNGLKKSCKWDELILSQVPSNPNLQMGEDSNEHLSDITLEEMKDELSLDQEEHDSVSDDDFSLVNVSSDLILNLLYNDEENEQIVYSGSQTSIESHFSAVILNEEYEDHLYNSDKGEPAFGEMDRRQSRQTRQEMSTVPVFHGEANAFALEICTALPDHENCLYFLFQAAFECFPDRDYCVASFPTDSKVAYLMRHFARVVPRCNSVFHHELYVLHRSAVLGRLRARVAVPEDKPRVAELAATLMKPAIVEDLFKEAVDTKISPWKAYTFLCEEQIIGMAIVSEEGEHEYLELYYQTDYWININECKFGNHGCLEHFLLSPIFQRHKSLFLRELHNLSGFDVLFYRLKRYDNIYTHRTAPIINALLDMIPVLPVTPAEYSKAVMEVFELPHSLQRHHQPFGLYISTPRLTSMTKIEINQKLVVIGAGCTGISFLESLVFGRNPNYLIVFTNITVVSPHGIFYHKQPSAVREMVFVGDGHLDRRYLDSVCLKTYVHVVTGVMTSINRKEKYVAMNDDTYLPYDYLFLMCGEQFQKPPQKKKEIVKKRSDFPQNVFIINTEADAGNAFNALKNLTGAQRQGNIVVFGHYLEALCCLAALLEFGFSGANLIYVDPTPDHIPKYDRHDHLTQFFNNSNAEAAVLDEIAFQGITIYQDYNFVEWHLDNSRNYIASAKFESKYKFVEIELSAFFIYHSKAISVRTFQAISRSGLVFNGRLVIDKNYQTNDPCIFGAGPLTIYSKKYYAEHLAHRYYNSQEIGHNLAMEVRKMLIPEKYKDPPETAEIFRKPVVQHCRFPGNLHYLQVSKAGPPVPLDVALNRSNYGRVLITGDCKKLDKQGYFRLHLNQFHSVETITCLAKFNLNVHNLISLWSKHEILLNHLLLRYDAKMISDLFVFFDLPWACAIYHKDFSAILEEIFDMLQAAETCEGTTLVEEVRKMLELNGWNALNKLQLDEIEETYIDSSLIQAIVKKVLDFLHVNYMYLPMYAHQMLIRWIMNQLQTSPLFVKTIFVQNIYSKSVENQRFPFFHRPSRPSTRFSLEPSSFFE